MQVTKKGTFTYNACMKDFKHYQGKTPDIAELAKSMAISHEGKSDRELFSEIYAHAEQGKKNGTLTNAQLDAFWQQISPMLDGAQRKKLKTVIEKLKKI